MEKKICRCRTTRSLVDNFSLEKLLNAMKISLWERRMATKVRLIQFTHDNTHHRNIVNLLENSCTIKRNFTIEKALSRFTTTELSEFQYLTIRNKLIK